MTAPPEFGPIDMADLEAMTFEEAIQCLQALVEALERGGLPLGQTTGLYQQGIRLVQRCNRLLSQAELKITQLHDSHSVLDLDQDESA